MTLLEQLQAHKGGLIRMKTQLYWYAGRAWDGNPGRVCVILYATRTTEAWRAAATLSAFTRGWGDAAVHLLIDGSPQWVWVAEKDVEVINEG